MIDHSDNKPQAIDYMSEESLYCLVSCLLHKLALVRTNPEPYERYLDSEQETIWKFLTALYGSGFNHKTREQKNKINYAIVKLLENKTPNEFFGCVPQVYNTLFVRC